MCNGVNRSYLAGILFLKTGDSEFVFSYLLNFTVINNYFHLVVWLFVCVCVFHKVIFLQANNSFILINSFFFLVNLEECFAPVTHESSK